MTAQSVETINILSPYISEKKSTTSKKTNKISHCLSGYAPVRIHLSLSFSFSKKTKGEEKKRLIWMPHLIWKITMHVWFIQLICIEYTINKIYWVLIKRYLVHIFDISRSIIDLCISWSLINKWHLWMNMKTWH